MPYRRLPNTDNARIRALRAVIDRSNTLYGQDVISYDQRKLEVKLRNFENAQTLYRESLDTQTVANRKFQKLIKSARLYVSHFIQVFNFCVIRNEIKKELRELYKLDVDSATVPDLTTNDALLTWGDNIIKGEQLRLTQGGTPIYNPTIARVNVSFSLFKDAYFAQKLHQNTTIRQLEILSEQREDIDATLALLWNQIEAAFSYLPGDERLERCKEFGIIYYLRKEEKEKLGEKSEDN